MKNKPIIITNQTINPGTRVSMLLPAPQLYTQTKVDIPIHVFHGKLAGPKLFIIGTMHGDEINSIEIIRRLHKQKRLKNLRGTLITIPVSNIFGFIAQTRYLPDRRDLNRCFPGSKEGSLAARLANILIEEVVTHCNYGIDLHTGAVGRLNMPQLRVNLATPGTEKLAMAFDVAVILDAKIRDNSLRAAANELGIPLLVYEGGEALRFNEMCIRTGLRGILKVLAKLNMIEDDHPKRISKFKPIITQTSRWVRAPASGLVQPLIEISKAVKQGQKLAYIHDPFLQSPSIAVVAPFDGIVVGKLNLPLVNEGDGMFHIASIKKLENVTEFIEVIQEELSSFDK